MRSLESTRVFGEQATYESYMTARNEFLSTFALKIDDHKNDVNKALQTSIFTSETKTTHRIVNLRPMLATSSQMTAYSALSFGSDGKQQANSSPRGQGPNNYGVQGRSRMGLRTSRVFGPHNTCHMGEYVVGGWCIGQVLDSAASRSSTISGSMGPRYAPNSHAINLYVDVNWWSANTMYRRFMNVDGVSTLPRYVSTGNENNKRSRVSMGISPSLIDVFTDQKLGFDYRLKQMQEIMKIPNLPECKSAFNEYVKNLMLKKILSNEEQKLAEEAITMASDHQALKSIIPSITPRHLYINTVAS